MVKKIIFIVIIALGIFLRLYHAAQLPAGLFLDEINMATDVKVLSQEGKDQYGRTWPFMFEDVTDFKLPGYLYLSVPMFKIFGNQLISIRAVSLITSILSIFLLGYLARLLFKKRPLIMWFSMIVLAISPIAIHFARIGYETTLATCFLIVYLIALIQMIRGVHEKWWFIIGALAIFICNWTYPAPRFIIPVFTLLLVLFGVVFRMEGVKIKQLVKTCIGFIGITILTFVPSLLFPSLDKRPLSYLQQDTKGSGWVVVIGKGSSIISSLLRNWNLEFLFDKGDFFAYRHGTKENGVFLQIFLVPFIVSIFAIIKNVSNKQFSLIFLLLFAFVAGFPSALTSGVPYGTRIIPLLIPITIFIAYGIDVIVAYVKNRNNIIKSGIYIVFFVILFYQIAIFAHIYFVHFANTSLPEFPKAPVAMAQYMKEIIEQHPNKQVYYLSDRSCRAWVNEGLHLWYFADLPNQKMIDWNNKFRDVRYKTQDGPFNAYDIAGIPPRAKVGNIILFPGPNLGADDVPDNSIFVRCGYTLENIDQSKEKILKKFYMYEDDKRELMYVVSEKIKK